MAIVRHMLVVRHRQTDERALLQGVRHVAAGIKTLWKEMGREGGKKAEEGRVGEGRKGFDYRVRSGQHYCKNLCLRSGMSVWAWVFCRLRKWGERSRRESLLGSRRFTFFLSFSSFISSFFLFLSFPSFSPFLFLSFPSFSPFLLRSIYFSSLVRLSGRYSGRLFGRSQDFLFPWYSTVLSEAYAKASAPKIQLITNKR